MRSRVTILIFVLLVVVSLQAAAPQSVVLDVQNMTCAVCKITVKKALEKVPGVAEASVDYKKKTATVHFDPDKTSPEELTRALTNAGFPSSVRR